LFLISFEFDGFWLEELLIRINELFLIPITGDLQQLEGDLLKGKSLHYYDGLAITVHLSKKNPPTIQALSKGIGSPGGAK